MKNKGSERRRRPQKEEEAEEVEEKKKKDTVIRITRGGGVWDEIFVDGKAGSWTIRPGILVAPRVELSGRVCLSFVVLGACARVQVGLYMHAHRFDSRLKIRRFIEAE